MKTALKSIFVFVALLISLAFFSYGAGAFYFIVNKTLPHDISYDTWYSYWNAYSSDPIQSKRLKVSLFLSFAAVYIAPFMAVYSLRKETSLHGDARFASASEISRAGLNSEKGIIVGKHRRKYLIFSGQQFVLLASPTRGGKGVAIVIPNLLNYSDSIVCFDTKGENFSYTSRFRSANGQDVFAWAPFTEDDRSHGWNPLDYISKDPCFRVADIDSIGHVIYPNTGDAKEDFFNEQARNLFLGLCLFLLETPSLPLTLGEVLRQSSGQGQPIRDYLRYLMASRSDGQDALSNECIDALNRFCSASDNTLNSILNTFNGKLIIFTNPIVDAATSKSDFDLRLLRKQRMTIYICVPPRRLASAQFLVNLFISQVINENINELPEQNPELKYQCLLLNDEFAAAGKIGIIAHACSFIAGYNLRLLTIVQSTAQLRTTYGDDAAETLIDNHGAHIVYPPKSNKESNMVSETLGYFTAKATSHGKSTPRTFLNNAGSVSENVSDQRRALMLPQELREMDRSKEILLLENMKPILCDKAYYFNDPSFVDRLKSVSPTLAALGKKLPTEEQLKRVAFVLKELSVDIPKLNTAIHIAKLAGRLRAVTASDEINVSSLALDLSQIPAFSDPENPTREEAEAIVDSIFSQFSFDAESSFDSSSLESQIKTDLDPNEISNSQYVEESNLIVPKTISSDSTLSGAFDLFLFDETEIQAQPEDEGVDESNESEVDFDLSILEH